MKTLNHNDEIRIATWEYPYNNSTVTVVTLKGHCEEQNENYEETVENTIKHGWEFCWTSNHSVFICSDVSVMQRENEKEKVRFENSILVENGEQVEIEGVVYTIRVNSGNKKHIINSNPISFIPQ